LVEYGISINEIEQNAEKIRMGETPLFYTCKSRNETLINYLIDHGVDINKERNNKYEGGNETVIKYLLDQGEDINKKNNNGHIPLFCTCGKGNETLAKYLVDLGAYVNEENKYCETPLYNTYVEVENEALVKYLVDHGWKI